MDSIQIERNCGKWRVRVREKEKVKESRCVSGWVNEWARGKQKRWDEMEWEGDDRTGSRFCWRRHRTLNESENQPLCNNWKLNRCQKIWFQNKAERWLPLFEQIAIHHLRSLCFYKRLIDWNRGRKLRKINTLARGTMQFAKRKNQI